MMRSSLQDIIKSKPHLAWDIREKENLSDKSALEHILAYGDWDDYIAAERVAGIQALSGLFDKLTSEKRSNLRPETKNFFTRYFRAYV